MKIFFIIAFIIISCLSKKSSTLDGQTLKSSNKQQNTKSLQISQNMKSSQKSQKKKLKSKNIQNPELASLTPTILSVTEGNLNKNKICIGTLKINTNYFSQQNNATHTENFNNIIEINGGETTSTVINNRPTSIKNATQSSSSGSSLTSKSFISSINQFMFSMTSNTKTLITNQTITNNKDSSNQTITRDGNVTRTNTVIEKLVDVYKNVRFQSGKVTKGKESIETQI